MVERWRVLNPSRITERLKDEPVDVRAAVADAIEMLLIDPYDPPGIETHKMRGVDDYEMRVAYLPDGWVLTYNPYPDGLMPLAGRLVKVRALVRLLTTD